MASIMKKLTESTKAQKREAHCRIASAWIDSQREDMIQKLNRWVGIPSETSNLSGLDALLQELKKDFAVLGGQMREVSLVPQQTVDAHGNLVAHPLGKALSILKRPKASLRIFLCVHMDTVYAANSPFQKTWDHHPHPSPLPSRERERRGAVAREEGIHPSSLSSKESKKLLNSGILQGPGVTDAKGGIVILLKALECLERSPLAKNIGWEVLLNPDEEIGSPGSYSLLKAAAKRNHLALLFEPSHPNGSLVSSRKGSGNFTLVARGVAAHAGRDFHQGKNAILALAEWLLELKILSQIHPEITINVGNIQGGGAVNVVPDLAIARFNIRTPNTEIQKIVEIKLSQRPLLKKGVTFKLHGGFTSPPKPFDEKTQDLAKQFSECAKELGFSLGFSPSGGVCDGNKLHAFGLPNLDSLGAVGGHIHSNKEFLVLDSLTQRAKLTALFLLKKACL